MLPFKRSRPRPYPHLGVQHRHSWLEESRAPRRTAQGHSGIAVAFVCDQLHDVALNQRCQFWSISEQVWATSGQSWSSSVQTWPIPGQVWSNSGQCCSVPGNCWRIPGSILVDFGESCLNLSTSSELSSIPDRIWPKLVEIGQTRPSLVESVPHLGPNSTDFNRFRPHFGRSRPGVGRSWSISTGCRPTWANVGPAF